MTEKTDTALILCAGYGSRLRPLTDKLPKPLLPVRGRPILFSILDKLRAAGIGRFFVNVHHRPEAFAEAFGLAADTFEGGARTAQTQYCGCPLVLVYEPEILETGGAVANLLEYMDKSASLAVHNGDILFDADASEFLARAAENLSDPKCCATLCLRGGGNLSNVSVDADGDVCDMRFTLKSPYEKLAQYTGFCVLNPRSYDYFAAADRPKFSIVETFCKMLSAGKRIGGVFCDGGEWADIGTRGEFARLNAGGLPDEWTVLARLCDAGFSPDGAELSAVAKGASTRRFFKFKTGGRGRVACFYSDTPRENYLYAPLAKFLHSRGIPVPEIFFDDPDGRVIVMQDAGGADLGEIPDSIRNDSYFAALRAAKKLHSLRASDFAAAGIELCAPFDKALYDWEQDYFFGECARGAFGLDLPRPDADFSRIYSVLTSVPPVPLFRDFQSQNVIVDDSEKAVKVIDFQGMRLGNPFYDVASLLFDPYIEKPFSDDFIDAALREYLGEGASEADFVGAQKMLYFAGAERLLQALGAYGFLSQKRGRTEYTKYFKPAARNLLACADRCALAQIAAFAGQIIKKSEKFSD